MSTYGVPSAYGTLKRVLMHRPGPELDFVTDKTIDEFHFARPVHTGSYAAPIVYVRFMRERWCR